ncbi:hypothetical protein DL771_005339 [Monosporascus sp. 5C6A]|nr:hypothetical protein DL771_005339 [Monosporascus sp. 5C6A]
MSGLEALSLACNIMTVISFASETVNACKAIYQGRSPDDQLIDIAASLAAASDELQNENQSMNPKPAYEHRLVDIASKCNIAARALDDEVKFLMVNHKKGSLKDTLRVAVKANWRKNRLERLEKSLHDYQRAMETQLLASIWKKWNATESQQIQGSKELRRDLQHFVSQYNLGYRQMSGLVQQENLSTRNHMTKDVVRGETSIKGHVTLQTSEAKESITKHITAETRNAASRVKESMRKATILNYTSNQRQTLLQSLKFQSMNERRNQVHDSYEGTFQWIFDPDHRTQDSSDDELSGDEWTDVEWSDDELSDDGWSIGHYLSWDNFNEWLKSDNDIYWIKGKAGSGKTIHELKQLSNVKICVSSRPEPRFQSRLVANQHLNLEDLTVADLRRYARGKLAPCMQAHQIAREVQDDIISELVSKAQGVFLYLCLAVQSLLRGLEGYETEEELLLRLDQLPNELSRLYADMWARLGDDQTLHQRAAVQYFKLVIAHEQWRGGPLPILQLMAATEPDVQRVMLGEGILLEKDIFFGLCTRLQYAIKDKCAGLLELSASFDDWVLRKHWQLRPLVDSGVEFIHRSAYDFFIDTEEGRRMLELDSSSDNECKLQLAKGILVMYQLGFPLAEVNPLLEMLELLATMTRSCLQEEVFGLFELCHKLYEAGTFDEPESSYNYTSGVVI